MTEMLAYNSHLHIGNNAGRSEDTKEKVLSASRIGEQKSRGVKLIRTLKASRTDGGHENGSDCELRGFWPLS
jgi:hypothetical protein